MNKLQPGLYFHRLLSKIRARYPLAGQLELTYRCFLDCVHCYCKGSEVRGQKSEVRELTTEEWKRVLDELQKEGCLFLCFTGGDPLIRKDFLELYSCAKQKGFMVAIFTSGQTFTPKIINHFTVSPPDCIEITLNGITKETYESVTKVPGSYSKAMRAIKLLKEKKIPFILKSNCLKQNKYEVSRVKAFTEELFDNLPRKKYRFKYDPMIHPRFNRDKTPCNYRLSFKELLETKKQDPDIWEEHQKGLRCRLPGLRRGRKFLYHCNSWNRQFAINPYGQLKFCMLSDKFNVNLRTTPFGEGFYNVFPQVLKEKFKTNSKCKNCRLRAICYHCPARAYLETGDEEAPVPYFCELAKATQREMKKAKQKKGIR